MTIEENNTCVYTMTHGPSCDLLPSYCTPLELGAAFRTEFLYDLHDDQGSNHISQKDKLYCELTGLYWLWKNDSHETTGLTHYRRLFAIEEKHIEKILETYDIILPLYQHLKQSCEEHYISSHIREDWVIMCNTLKEMYPEYYVSSKNVFSKKRFIPCNMFIAKHEIVNAYCSWLFPLLFSIEAKLNLTNRTNYQSRAIGFLAERLFTLWINHNNLKIKQIPILSIGDKTTKQTSLLKSDPVCYLISVAICLPYSEWTSESCGKREIRNAVNDGRTKRTAVKIYRLSRHLFYLFGKLYCKHYS